MKRIALVALVVLSFSSFGCGKLREKLAGKAVEEGSSGTVTVSSGGATITTPTGTIQAATGAKLPDGWPSSIPQYPGSSVVSSMASPVGKTAVLNTTDSPQKVHDFYKGQISMKLATDVDANGSKVMAFRDGAKTLSITVTPTGAQTQITVSAAGF
jgi:hypothetical protein